VITAAAVAALAVSGAFGAISHKPVTKATFTAATSETFNVASGNFTADGKVTFRGGGRKAPFNAHAQGQVTSPGTAGISGNTFTTSGRVSKGTFTTTPAKKGANWFGKGPGTFVARDGSQQDLTTGNGTDSGIALITFKKRGMLCAQFTEHFMGAASATGTFSTLGGTGDASRFAANGQFTSTLSGMSYSTQTSGTAKILKHPKGLTPECQQLQSL
jgi:hypothetical protein